MPVVTCAQQSCARPTKLQQRSYSAGQVSCQGVRPDLGVFRGDLHLCEVPAEGGELGGTGMSIMMWISRDDHKTTNAYAPERPIPINRSSSSGEISCSLDCTDSFPSSPCAPSLCSVPCPLDPMIVACSAQSVSPVEISTPCHVPPIICHFAQSTALPRPSTAAKLKDDTTMIQKRGIDCCGPRG